MGSCLQVRISHRLVLQSHRLGSWSRYVFRLSPPITSNQRKHYFKRLLSPLTPHWSPLFPMEVWSASSPAQHGCSCRLLRALLPLTGLKSRQREFRTFEAPFFPPLSHTYLHHRIHSANTTSSQHFPQHPTHPSIPKPIPILRLHPSSPSPADDDPKPRASEPLPHAVRALPAMARQVRRDATVVLDVRLLPTDLPLRRTRQHRHPPRRRRVPVPAAEHGPGVSTRRRRRRPGDAEEGPLDRYRGCLCSSERSCWRQRRRDGRRRGRCGA